jgi:hypothetical protein
MEVLPEAPAGFPVDDLGAPGTNDEEPDPTAVAVLVTVRIRVVGGGGQVLIPGDAPAAVSRRPGDN